MNLTNRDCFREVAAGITKLAGRFDWDGINLAELYFESLEGIDNPARFTPLNQDVRAMFRRTAGFDPLELFQGRADAASRRVFLDFRSDLVRRMQEEWLAEMEKIRAKRPHLDLVLTHVDDRFDHGMRDAIGADAARVLPLLERQNFTFLIEDPATVWHLGPQRYREIAERYRPLTSRPGKLAIDLNIVERYQDVYPTKQQTGIELFQLVHQAAAGFDRVALYFENSLLQHDLKLLASAASADARLEQLGPRLVIDSAHGTGLAWREPALVDGELWPVADDETLWLPPGRHMIERAKAAPGLRVTHFNGTLRSARVVSEEKIELSYESAARAIAVLNRPVDLFEIDGIVQPLPGGRSSSVMLPRGQHVVAFEAR
jgi:hypothetical protein